MFPNVKVQNCLRKKLFVVDQIFNLSDHPNRVDINGTQLVYDLSGDGSPIISIHAGLCDRMNKELWERIANEPDGGSEVELEPPIPTRLAEIQIPTLLIVGDLDQPMTVESMAILEEKIPHSETVIVTGTGHLPNMERPDEFNRQDLAFLEHHRV